jgi:diguanylate cyclase (GGDEF)-like protein
LFAVEPFNPANFLVLVVDDLNINLQIVGAILDREGYATTFATNGQQALSRMNTAVPDLILLDLMMPEMDGFQVCEQVRTHPERREIPIIFLTASQEKKHLLQAFDRGAVDYITKPFNPPELLARVKTHLELKHTRDELRKAVAELERLATTDSLTGIANRRYLLLMGENEFNRARRYDRQLSVLMLDVDRFKQINDTYGHALGDEALQAIAKAIVSALRKGDSFGRFGGEEFVAFLPETALDDAVEVANRIRTTIAQLCLFSRKKPVQMTVSIGATEYSKQDENLDKIIQRADRALYHAKHRGRNLVVAISPTDFK